MNGPVGGERPSSTRLRHHVAGGALAALGLGSLAVVAVHLTHESEPLLGIVLGIVPPAVLSLAVVAVGIWLAVSGLSRGNAGRVVGWTAAGGAIGGASAVMFVLYQSVHTAALADAEFAITAAANGGMAAGLLIAAYDVRARRRQAAAEATSRILETVRQVLQAASHADDPERLEVRVCEEFEDASPYVFAWIGEPVEASGEVRPRTATESAEPYLASITIPLDPDDEARGPTARAIETGRPQVVDDVSSNPNYEPWRESAGSFGVQSSIAVPLVHDGDQFGVLNVYADRVGAFGERERQVLAELGETIAQAQARLAYRDRLERHADQHEALNQLLRHDIRNDMSVIMAHGERLRDGEIDDDSLDLLLDKVDHVVELTRTARELSRSIRIEGDEPERVRLDQVLLAVLEDVSGSYPAASISVDGDLPAVAVRADDALSSVFENLLNNAVQHHGGDHPTVEVGVEAGPDTVEVTVADDGRGIPDAMKERVFEHGESGPQSSGTGLGLYLVDSLVTHYGGEVTVADNEPRGTVVRVTLQRA